MLSLQKHILLQSPDLLQKKCSFATLLLEPTTQSVIRNNSCQFA